MDNIFKEYLTEYDDTVKIINADKEKHPEYGRVIAFQAHEDLAQIFIDKINEKYNIGAKVSDVGHFEYYEVDIDGEEKAIASALFTQVFAYKNKSYLNYDFDLSGEETALLKDALEKEISRQVDREAMAEIDRNER